MLSRKIVRNPVLFVSLLVALGFVSCEEPKKTQTVKPLEGPIESVEGVRLLYSEQAHLKVKLTTRRQFRYLNEDRVYPDTVHIEFYGPAGDITTTLRSDSGRYTKSNDLYTVMGNVVVINRQKQERLLTTELNWHPTTKKIATDKPITVISKLTGEKLNGIGLDANQDFSEYRIRKTTGIFNVGSSF